jgi:hypothetical protein
VQEKMKLTRQKLKEMHTGFLKLVYSRIRGGPHFHKGLGVCTCSEVKYQALSTVTEINTRARRALSLSVCVCVCVRERETSHLLRLVLACRFFYPEHGGDMFLQNVGSHKNYMVPHPRKRHSSNQVQIADYLLEE